MELSLSYLIVIDGGIQYCSIKVLASAHTKTLNQMVYFIRIVLASSTQAKLVKHDGCLDGALVAHRLQTLRPLLDPEHLVYNAVHFDLSGIQIIDCTWELVGLAE